MNLRDGIEPPQGLAAGAASPAALRRALESQFTTESEPVAIGSWQVELLRPRNADDLISEADFVRDERLPYWADLWPAARVLAAALIDAPLPAPTARAPRLLELGCGLGLATIAALHAGFDVVATDYYADALRFTSTNAWRAVQRMPATRLVDWRDFPGDLGTFDRVIAADVLYEHAYAPLLSAAIARTLARDGAAVIADPGRVAAPAFLDGLVNHDLVLTDTVVHQYVNGAIHQEIALYTVTHRP
jgi:predicted nicotinamide N-methyase